MLDQTFETPISGNYFEVSKKLRGAARLRCADLFSGAGGFSLAAMNVGMKVSFALEQNKHAMQTYSANLTAGEQTKIFNEDIRQLSPETASQFCGLPAGSLDILLGGPPCQGYSVHRINGAGIGDPRNDLILSYFEYVDFFRPRIFLMENVPGILWPRHQNYLDAFYIAAERKGYFVHPPVVLEAADFGVPQKRKRVFILGVKNDVSINLDWPAKGNRSERLVDRENHLPWRTSRTVFDRPVIDGDPNNIHMNHGPELIEVFKSTPPNGGSRMQSCRTLKCHEGYKGHKDVYGRIDPDKPGPTMTASCINPSKGRFVHPTEHHGITVRHAARFQTFPDEFRFEGGLIASGVQIGNAVPILMGENILRELARALLKC